MARYIDADALESELFRDGIAGIFLNYPRRRKFTIGEIRAMLKNEHIAPTVDVVPSRELADALLVCEVTKGRVRECEAEIEQLRKAYSQYEETTGLKQQKSEAARKILTEIKQAFETYGGTYGMKQRIAELMQEYGIKDCTDCRHFVGCETACGGRICGEFEEKQK